MDGQVDPPSIPTGIVRAGGPYSARPLEIGQWANQARVSHSRASSRRLMGLLPHEIRRHRHASRCVRIGERLCCRLSDWAGICRRAPTSQDTTRMSAIPALRPGSIKIGLCPPTGRGSLHHLFTASSNTSVSPTTSRAWPPPRPSPRRVCVLRKRGECPILQRRHGSRFEGKDILMYATSLPVITS
jgi:hypothetical protein